MKFRYWAGLIILYGISLVVTAPASLLPWVINRALPIKLTSTHASGTVWRGSAHNFGIWQPEQGGQNFGDLDWEMDFSRLLRGQQGWRFKLHGANASGQGQTWISLNGLQIQDIQLSIPAETLATITPRIAAWKPQGRLMLSSPALTIGHEHLQGQAEIRWERAALGISQVRPLGTWQAVLTAGGQSAQIRLDTLDGPLALKGQGDWSRNNGLRFNGTASAHGRQDELKPLLTLIGRPIPGQKATVEVGIK